MKRTLKSQRFNQLTLHSLQTQSLHADELAAAYATDELERTALTAELERTASTEDRNLQQRELAAAFASELAIQHQSLQEKELSTAYATALPKELDRTALAMELESTALTLSSLQQQELARLKAFKLHTSTRACQDKLAARKRQRTTHSLSSTSFLSIFLLMVISSLTLPSLTLTSLSLPSSFGSFPACWAQELAEQDELLTTFGKPRLVKNELRENLLG